MRCRQDVRPGTCGAPASLVLASRDGSLLPLCDEHLGWTREFRGGDVLREPTPEDRALLEAREVMES